jgi:hypothetical protein
MFSNNRILLHDFSNAEADSHPHISTFAPGFQLEDIYRQDFLIIIMPSDSIPDSSENGLCGLHPHGIKRNILETKIRMLTC